ncbi:PIN domain-containing protein [Agromyces sp. NPDC058484]|uniref:PIN domain-containing protein n=1 Tax=Agromyces sp. NPDC058484 TaxID=3346524 RepID=UPI003654D1C8
MALVELLDFTATAAVHAGEIRADLAQIGRPIAGYDVLIAGHARSAGLTVVTNNVREFERVPGLLLATGANPEFRGRPRPRATAGAGPFGCGPSERGPSLRGTGPADGRVAETATE